MTRVLISGGGTGGHLAPGVAIMEAILDVAPQAEVLFATDARGAGLGIIPASARRVVLPAPRPGPGLLRAIASAGRLAGAYRAASEAVAGFAPDIAIALGGYPSVLPAVAAARAGVPLVLVEQNAVAGRANRFLARWAEAVLAPPSIEAWVPGPARLVPMGVPVRRSIRTATPYPRAPGRPTLLVIGGSQGARAINRFMADHVATIAKRSGPLRVLAATGREDRPSVAMAMERAGVAARVVDFFTDPAISAGMEDPRSGTAMASAYAAADLVLARAGGSTVAEVAARGIPSVLVPLPGSVDGHQDANARWLADRGAALVIPEAGLGAGAAVEVGAILSDSERRAILARAARRAGRPRAAGEAAAIVIGLVARHAAGRVHRAG